jgi:thiol-disulfide isomerase/thioredoxin
MAALAASIGLAAALVAGCGGASTTASTGASASTADPAPSSAGPTGTASGTGEAEQPKETATGTASAPEPVAALRFTATTLDGQKFDGASLAGKPVVFWFWAPWCPKCHYEAPAVKAAAGKYRDVAFVGVAGLDTEPEMKEFVQRTKTGSLTHLPDEKGAVWTKLGVTQQSTFVFMRPDGSTSKASGPLGAETLDGHVAKLLS